jgi:hypothetical protein
MFRRRKLKLAIVIVAVAILFIWLIPGSENVPLQNKCKAQFKRASLVRSVWPEAFSTLTYQPKDGRAGKIVLWQSIFDGPVMLMSANDPSRLLCLYDYDTYFCLLKIDTVNRFKPVPPKSDLNSILFACTWAIEDGTDADWQEVMDYLHAAFTNSLRVRTFSVGFRGRPSPGSLLHSLEYQGRKKNISSM